MESENKKRRWTNKWNLYKSKLLQTIRRYKYIRTTFYVLFGIIFVGGYAFFFNSKQLFAKNEVSIVASSLGREYELEGRKFKIVRWDYADQQDCCEVELDVIDTAFDDVDYSVVCLDRQKGKLDTSIVLQESNLLIIHINQIPDDFAELSLQIKVNDHTLKLYGTKNSVTSVERLDVLTPKEYKVQRLHLQIEQYEKGIIECQDAIANARDKIQRCEKDKQILLEEMPLQTQEQQKETEVVIQSADSQIETENRRIKECEEKIAEYQELISATQEKVDTFK